MITVLKILYIFKTTLKYKKELILKRIKYQSLRQFYFIKFFSLCLTDLSSKRTLEISENYRYLRTHNNKQKKIIKLNKLYFLKLSNFHLFN